MRRIVPFPGAVVIEIGGIGAFGRNRWHLKTTSVSGRNDPAARLHEAPSGPAATLRQGAAGKSLLSESLSQHPAISAILRRQDKRKQQGCADEANSSIHGCTIKAHRPFRLPTRLER